LTLAQQALLLRYPTVEESPIAPDTLLQAHRPEDEGDDLWLTMNRCQEGLLRGDLSDGHRDWRGKLRFGASRIAWPMGDRWRRRRTSRSRRDRDSIMKATARHGEEQVRWGIYHRDREYAREAGDPRLGMV